VGIADEELEKLYERGCKERAEILRRAGEVPTIERIAKEIEPKITELEKRRELLEKMIADGILEYREVETGVIRKTEEELGRTHKLLEETWEQYRNFCKEKAHEYLNRAEEDLREGFPKAAEERLRTALGRFRALPDEEKRDLECKLTRVKDLIELEERIDQTKDLREKLKLLLQAKGKHPDYPGFDWRIKRAKSELAAEISREIQIKYAEARAALKRGDFGRARSICNEAQRLVVKDVEETEVVAKALADIDALLKQIEEEEAHRQKLVKRAQEIEKVLNKGEYDVAEELLEELSDDDKRDPHIQALRVRLAQYKDDAWTYNQALSAYQDGNYSLTIKLCDEIARRRGKLPPKFEEIRRKARAGEAFNSAIEMLGKDLDKARKGFRKVKRLDGGRKEECDRYLREIKYVRKELDKAEGYKRQGKWKEAYETLIAIRDVSPGFMPLIDERKSVLRSNWYKQLKEDIQRSLSHDEPDHERAFKLISIMRDYGLLLEDEDRELAYEVELNYYKNNALFYEDLKDWGEAAKWWEKVVQIWPRKEAINKLRQARKNECLREVLLARLDRDYEKAINTIKRARQEGLEGDPDLLFELAKTCLEAGHLDEAAQHAQSVKIVQENYPGLDELQTKIEEEQEIDAALKKSQSLFEKEEYEKAIEAIKGVEEAYPARRELKRKREELTKQAVELLLKKAERERPSATGPKLAEVIRTYDRVLRLDPSNRAAQEGIEASKAGIPQLIQETIAEAQGFDATGKEPREALIEAASLISKIEDCRVISKYTSRPSEHSKRLDVVLGQIARKHTDLQDMIGLMENARRELNRAVESGEFSFAERAIRGAIDKARDLYPHAPEELRRLKEEIEEIKEKRQEAQRLLKELQGELRNDDNPQSFDRIIEICTKLEGLDPYDRFRLQEEGTTIYDEYLKKEISGLKEHKRIAEARKANYEFWKEWYERVENLYKEARALFEEAQKKREQASLREAIDAYATCLTKCEEAEGLVARKPEEEPISWLAEKLENSAKEVLSDIQSYKRQAQEKKAECEKGSEQVEKLKGLISDFLNRPLSGSNLDSAEKFLRDALEIDSKDEELQELGRQLREKREQLEKRRARRWPFRR